MAAASLPASLRRLTQGGLTLAASNIVGAGLAFAVSLVVGRGLGDRGFGEWTFSLAWASALAMVADFGLNTLVTREAARRREQSNQVLLGALAAKLGAWLILGGLAFAAAPRLGIDGAPGDAIRMAVLLAAAATTYGTFTAVLRAAGRMAPILWLNAGGLLLQFIWSAWALPRGAGVLYLVGVAVAAQTAQTLAAAALWWSELRPAGGPLRISKTLVFQLARGALPFALAGLLGALQLRSAPLLLGYLRGGADVGWFGAAWRFSEAAKLIPNGVFAAAFPALAAGLAAGADGRLFRKFSRGLMVMAVILAAGLGLLAWPMLRLAYGTEFLPGAPALVWLALALVPALANGAIKLYLYAAGEETFANLASAAAVAVQLVVSVPLIMAWGASGAAVGLLIGEAALWYPLRRRLRRRNHNST